MPETLNSPTLADLERLTKSLADIRVRQDFTSHQLITVLEALKLEAQPGGQEAKPTAGGQEAQPDAGGQETKPPAGDHEARILESLRVLRNSVAGVEANSQVVQQFFLTHFDIWEFAGRLIVKVDDPSTSPTSASLRQLRVTLQLLANLSTTDNSCCSGLQLLQLCQAVTTSSCAADPLCQDLVACHLLNLLRRNSSTSTSSSSNSCNTNNRSSSSDDTNSSSSVNDKDGLLYKKILDFLPVWLENTIGLSTSNSNNSNDGNNSHKDFTTLVLRYLPLSPYFPQLTREVRVSLVPWITELGLVEGEDGGEHDGDQLPPYHIHLLAGDFTFLTDTILTTTLGDASQVSAGHLTQLLDLLILASQHPRYLTLLQGRKSLIINTLYLLRMVHDAGKQQDSSSSSSSSNSSNSSNNSNNNNSSSSSSSSNDMFKPIGKLSDVQKAFTDGGLEACPVYGFKASLIRLLVNLVWDHSEHKTLVGELGGLELLLDCSQIDAKNPLITQWVILAVKALTADHPVNQSTLASMKRVGQADTSNLLRELGIKVVPSSAATATAYRT